MTSLNPNDLEKYEAYERQFWSVLELTLRDVLHSDTQFATTYKESLFEAPVFERMLALHDDPLDIASTLTGIPISNAIRARYEELLTTQIVNITQFGGALLEQQNLFDSFESTVAELPSPRRSGLVSLPKLQTIMSDLGYEYAGEHERHLIYMKAKNGEPDLPPGFRVYPPPYRTAHGYSAYEAEAIAHGLLNFAKDSEAKNTSENAMKRIYTVLYRFFEEFELFQRDE